MTFEIGERVVHPQYGVGEIVNLEDREFGSGVPRQYYEVSIPDGSTVWVPVRRVDSGLRRLATRAEIAECRMILESAPVALADDARVRQAELAAHLKEGKISAHCEVVRDLVAFGAHRSMVGNIGAFLRAVQDVLSQEWAVVEGTTLAQAVYEINSLLEQGRQAISQRAAAESSQIESSEAG